ncbi:MAG: hypothetical protein V9G12_08285 [Microthrixaceae bacterium]
MAGFFPAIAVATAWFRRFVELGTQPLVEFEFTVSAGRHRISRTPAYIAPKRGGGTTPKAGGVHLERLTDDGWASVSTKQADVRAEIEHVIGLKRRAVPPGDPAAAGQVGTVLQADSDKREELLRTLFDTTLFSEMTSWLEERAATAVADAERIEARLDDLSAEARLKWGDLRAGRGHRPASTGGGAGVGRGGRGRAGRSTTTSADPPKRVTATPHRRSTSSNLPSGSGSSSNAPTRSTPRPSAPP